VTALSLLGLLLTAGCGPEPTVELRYFRPAAYEISAKVKKLAIAEFGGHTGEDRKWGNIAADKCASALDEYNKKYSRYELVDRKRLKGIMDERDLKISISDPNSAAQIGKLAEVDAMIYGNVAVTSRDERLTKAVFNPIRQTTEQVTYVRRYSLASVNFTMDDVGTGVTIVTVSTKHEYDSEKPPGEQSGGKKFMKMMGYGGGDLPAADQTINTLVEQCVEDFLRKISPHEVVVSEKLAKGEAKAVQTGNKLALAKEYKEALECYEAALEQNSQDHGALFNAGLMYEALVDLKKAEEMYGRAFKIKDDARYVLARKRVRTEAKA
jgi:tetratricopeptide (TPR) repeat protein